MDVSHQHPPDAACPPTCPAWSEGALHLFSLQRRYREMLAACQAADAVESVIVAPSAPGVKLPDYLAEEDLVRLNMVVGRDTSELLLDEWGMRCTLTFRGRRADCAVPWEAVMGGTLRPPPRGRPRFQLIEGGKKE